MLFSHKIFGGAHILGVNPIPKLIDAHFPQHRGTVFGGGLLEDAESVLTQTDLISLS